MEKIVVYPKCDIASKVINTKQVNLTSSETTKCSFMSNKTEKDDFDRLLDEFISNGTNENETESTIKDSNKTDRQQPEYDKCLEEKQYISAEMRLENMIGLAKVKSDMADARIMALFVKQRRILSLDTMSDNRHHMLFLGNPGTGKTTIAKLVGEMYYNMGLLSSGHTIETNRSELIGEFIGQTEKNTNEAIERARGGVLFIDEAYTLINGRQDSNDFGKEVINSLLAILSDPNPDMIVILAGYENQMQQLLTANPGLKERFPLKFYFEDYTKEELLEIAHSICKSRNFKLTPDADKRLSELIGNAILHRDEYFGNGRWVHNLIEHGVIKSMAKRVMNTKATQDEHKLFSLIEECDIIETEQRFLQNSTIKTVTPMRIGFTA